MSDENQATEATEATPETPANSGVRIVVDRTKYTKTATGLHNGDEVALMLDGKSLEDTYALAAERTGKSVDELKAKYEKHNKGMQRMFLGNMIRAKIKAETPKAA